MRALVDTGAHNSCISRHFVNHLGFQKEIIASSRRRLFTASGKPMTVAGTIQLTLDIHNLKIPVTFNVINVLMHDVILGLDFLTQTEANIDFSSRVLTLYDDLVGVNLTKSSDVVLKTIDAVVIPPKSEAAIPVSVPARHGSVLSIVEPSVTLNQKHLALAKALVVPRGNRTICKILNPTDSHIFLRRRTAIGVIEKISIDSVNIVFVS